MAFALLVVGPILACGTNTPEPPPSAASEETQAQPDEETPEEAPEPELTADDRQLAIATAEAERLADLEDGSVPDAFVAALEDWARDAENVTYAQLERNAVAYAHHKAVFSGTVLEIRDRPGDETTFLRLATRSYGRNVLWVETIITPDDRIVENSRVRVYGYLWGNRSYTSQAGWEIEIPQFVAVSVVDRRTPQTLSPTRRAGLQPAPQPGPP